MGFGMVRFVCLLLAVVPCLVAGSYSYQESGPSSGDGWDPALVWEYGTAGYVHGLFIAENSFVYKHFSFGSGVDTCEISWRSIRQDGSDGFESVSVSGIQVWEGDRPNDGLGESLLDFGWTPWTEGGLGSGFLYTDVSYTLQPCPPSLSLEFTWNPGSDQGQTWGFSNVAINGHGAQVGAEISPVPHHPGVPSGHVELYVSQASNTVDAILGLLPAGGSCTTDLPIHQRPISLFDGHQFVDITGVEPGDYTMCLSDPASGGAWVDVYNIGVVLHVTAQFGAEIHPVHHHLDGHVEVHVSQASNTADALLGLLPAGGSCTTDLPIHQGLIQLFDGHQLVDMTGVGPGDYTMCLSDPVHGGAWVDVYNVGVVLHVTAQIGAEIFPVGQPYHTGGLIELQVSQASNTDAILGLLPAGASCTTDPPIHERPIQLFDGPQFVDIAGVEPGIYTMCLSSMHGGAWVDVNNVGEILHIIGECVGYPGCFVDHCEFLGSGFCEGGDYNTQACGFDGGDCLAVYGCTDINALNYDPNADHDDGTCTYASTLCTVNQYVSSGVCTACPAGTTNTAGDDSAGGDTTCDATMCAANEYVSSNVCTACAAGTTNAAGDDASLGDTTCDPTTTAAPPVVPITTAPNVAPTTTAAPTGCGSQTFGPHEALPPPLLDSAQSGIDADGKFNLVVTVPWRLGNPTIRFLNDQGLPIEHADLEFPASSATIACQNVYSFEGVNFHELVNTHDAVSLIDRGDSVWFHGTLRVEVTVPAESNEFGITFSNNDREGIFHLDYHVVIPKSIDTGELNFSVDAPTGDHVWVVDFDFSFDTSSNLPVGPDFIKFKDALLTDLYAAIGSLLDLVNGDELILTDLQYGSWVASVQIRAADKSAIQTVLGTLSNLSGGDFSSVLSAFPHLAFYPGNAVQTSNVRPTTVLFGASATLRTIEKIVDPTTDPTGYVDITMITSVSAGYTLEADLFHGPHNLTVEETAAEDGSPGCNPSAPGNTQRCEQYWHLTVHSANCDTSGDFFAKFLFKCNRVDGGSNAMTCPDLSTQQLEVSFSLPDEETECSVMGQQDLTLEATLKSYDAEARDGDVETSEFLHFSMVYLRAEVTTLNEIISSTSLESLTLHYTDGQDPEVELYSDANAGPHPSVEEWQLQNTVQAGAHITDFEFLLGPNLFTQDQDTVRGHKITGRIRVEYTDANGHAARRLLDVPVESSSVTAETSMVIRSPAPADDSDSTTGNEDQGGDDSSAAVAASLGWIIAIFAYYV